MRAFFILFIIYLILTLIGCLDEFSTLKGGQSANATSMTGTSKAGEASKPTVAMKCLSHSGPPLDRRSTS